jgi:CheY-like chemotaxis protein
MLGEPILIVDDTPVNLKLTRMLLEYEGYEVRTAASAEEALEMLEAFRPRLVLADIQLPGIDGLEMTRRIKSDPRNRGILVVALTAYAMKGDEDKAIEAGCDGYITKPIDTRALGSRLREYLGQGPPPKADGTVPEAPSAGLLPDDELRDLRQSFLAEGLGLVRRWNDELYGAFQPADASFVAHQWVGSAGLLGFRRISSLAREAEHALRERPLDTGQFRDLLQSLEGEFRAPTHAGRSPEMPRPPDAPAQARVLIADDDQNMLALVKAIAETQGIECHTAADGIAALEAIRRTKPDIVALGENLPEMTGTEILAKLQEVGLSTKVLLLAAGDHVNPIDLVVKLKRMM